MNQKRVEVLDCTLRDGSYVIDFQFTAKDTVEIVSALSDAGVEWIEIGHGIGLGAQDKHGAAAASDEEYIEAAVSAAGNAKVGCFFIPGIGSKEQIAKACELGLKFIRIGTNASDIEAGIDTISYARDLGLNVSANLMKSYVLTPFDICRATKKAVDAGATTVSLVDSAGGMFPDEVGVYIKAMVETVDAKIGFHGHNNLGLANACAIAALKAGAVVIDSTLQGMGRSSGNALTESMLLIYEKLGYHTGIDYFKVMDIGEKLIRPHLGPAGFTGVQVASGFALFHSSYMKHVDEASLAFDIDPRALIIEVSKIDKDKPTRALFMEVAARLVQSYGVKEVRFPNMLSEGQKL